MYKWGTIQGLRRSLQGYSELFFFFSLLLNRREHVRCATTLRGGRYSSRFLRQKEILQMNCFTAEGTHRCSGLDFQPLNQCQDKLSFSGWSLQKKHMLPEPVKKKEEENTVCKKKTSRMSATIKLLLKTLMKKQISNNNLICTDQVHELWLLTASVEFNRTSKRPCNRIHSQQFLLDILLQKSSWWSWAAWQLWIFRTTTGCFCAEQDPK